MNAAHINSKNRIIMKKFLILVFLSCCMEVYSQHVILSHYGDVLSPVDDPTYTYCIGGLNHDVFDFEDPVLCSFLDRVIADAIPIDSTCLCTSYIWHDMIHIVYVKNKHKYYTINLTHYDKRFDYQLGCLEIDGQLMQYNKEFQIVMDNIVNYYINYHPKKKDFIDIIHQIILGKRYQLYMFQFPTPK